MSLACGSTKPASTTPSVGQRPSEPSIVERKEPGLPGGAEVCFNAFDDNENGLLDEGCGVSQGQVQVAISWPDSKIDVDLLVRDPEGEIAKLDEATGAGLTRTADCPGEEKKCPAPGYESVFLESHDNPPGRYEVRVRVEKIPLELSSAPVSLGIRAPGVMKEYELELFSEGQELIVHFDVQGSSKKKEKKGKPRE